MILLRGSVGTAAGRVRYRLLDGDFRGADSVPLLRGVPIPRQDVVLAALPLRGRGVGRA
jgi:hypothetical protein